MLKGRTKRRVSTKAEDGKHMLIRGNQSAKTVPPVSAQQTEKTAYLARMRST